MCDSGGPSNKNSVLWNSMILPITSMPIKGAIFYQGESDCNAHMAPKYNW